MPQYFEYVSQNPLLFTSPCAEKFHCPNRELNKNVCAPDCPSLAFYRKLLDTYGKYSMGGLSVGHPYQSAICISDDEFDISVHQARGNRKSMLDPS